MNLQLLLTIMTLLPQVTMAVQTLAGDVTEGKTKQQMAVDMLNAATNGALSVTTGTNNALAQAASSVAGNLINSVVAVQKIINPDAWKQATATGNAVVAATTSTVNNSSVAQNEPKSN